MEKTDEEICRHSSGIQNYYYGGVNNVINLKLTKEEIDIWGSGNQLAQTLSNLFNPLNQNGHGK